MTYSEWFMATCGRFGITESEVNIILVNQSALIPNPSASVNVAIAKKALVREFAVVIPIGNVTEGGYSVSWNMDAIKLWYQSMCAEVGERDVTRPVIRNKSNVW